MFIGRYNVQLESYRMVVTTSIYALSCRDDVCACSMTVFVPYPLHNFQNYVIIFLLVAMAYSRPYATPSPIHRLCQSITSFYIFSLCIHVEFNYFFI